MKKIIKIPILITGLVFVLGSCQMQNGEQADRDKFVSQLLSQMTLEEKIGQMTLFTSGWDVTGPVLNENYRQDILAGRCGNIFNAHTVTYNLELQKMAVEETRLGIPLLFGYDVVHGHQTIFPIPLAEACAWDLDLAEESARLAAKEAAASGLNWTFAPMVDLSRDPRWGRVAEGTGEDTWLTGQYAAAKVRGFQGESLSDPVTLAACVKHYAAYGAPVAGRDYATVDLSELSLRNDYLPPYHEAVKAGVASLMTGFNEIHGVPCSSNRHLMNILRKEWGFEGIVVTDYTGINEIVHHGYAKNLKQAGELAVEAGVDLDMQGSVYLDYLMESVEEGAISEKNINQAVRRLLNLKYDLGLFEDPYRYLNASVEKAVVCSDELMEHALEAARQSIVLLKNEAVQGEKLLPVNSNVQKIALIGPLADNRVDLLGSWHAAGDVSKVNTLLEVMVSHWADLKISYAKGCETVGDDRSGFAPAVDAARNADLVIMAVGENYQQNGEAASRSQLGLPGAQQELLDEVVATGKPVIVLVMAGRPLVLTRMSEQVPAIVNCWHLGTKAAEAIVDVLSGSFNPSGKLVMSFPRNEGQIPVYYNQKNSGRPFDPNNKYTSKYIDVSNDPLYPFGYGRSYTTFSYADLKISADTMSMNNILTASVMVKNTGMVGGSEIVQLYIRDLVGSVTRPVMELKGFKKVFLKPGEELRIEFSITGDDLKFYRSDLSYDAEPGAFNLMIGASSAEYLTGSFYLQE